VSAGQTDHGRKRLIFIVAATLIGVVLTLVAGWSPLLGLDLQGGASVVLEPVVREGEDAEITDEALDQTIEIIRNRVDGLGVAEPEIRRQGDAVLIQLPGVENQARALELVGTTAELRFRPVLAVTQTAGLGQPVLLSDLFPEDGTPTGSTTSTTTSTTSTTSTTTTSVPASETTVAPTSTTLPDGNELSEAELRELDDQQLFQMSLEQAETLSEDQAALIEEILGDRAQEQIDAILADVTRPEEDQADQVVLLPEVVDGEVVALYTLGPTMLTGEALETASFSQQAIGSWQVNPIFKGGDDGIALFNAAAVACNGGANPECPAQPGGTNGQLAIVLDSVVVSAPEIQAASFDRDQIQISGSFDRGEADDLALQLRYGALPIELAPQSVDSVSASLGSDALRAGVIAGIVGLLLVATYMIAYYRLLGVVAVVSLIISSTLLWVIVSFLGSTQGLALTLAGVTGIIVSIGVSLDSNVVYFEHLKEDVRNGRTLRTSVERSFSSAFSTIVKADTASLIAAGVLWFLTVGAVKGFAFYLGLATLLDLLVSYFFMGPAVQMLGTNPKYFGRPKVFGMPEPRSEEAVA